MKAILLAGGKGTRLRPLTIHTPKPIVPIFDRPFLHYQIDLLKQVPEIDEVILSLNYQPRRIEEIFGDGSELGIKIRYVVEPAPLGTAGAVKYAGDSLTESVVVFNGDVLTADRSRRRDPAAPRAAGPRHHRAHAGRQPERVRAGRDRCARATSAASSRSRARTRSPPTRSTPASTCSSPTRSTGFRATCPGRSSAATSRRSSSGARPSSPTYDGATGSTSARLRSTPGAPRHHGRPLRDSPFDGLPPPRTVVRRTRASRRAPRRGPLLHRRRRRSSRRARASARTRSSGVRRRSRRTPSIERSIVWPNCRVSRDAGRARRDRRPRCHIGRNVALEAAPCSATRPRSRLHARLSRRAAETRPPGHRTRQATTVTADRRLSIDADHPGIFKAYDVRGLYPARSTRTVARQIGRGFVAYLKADAHRRLARHARVVAGARRRPSSRARANRAPTSSTTACSAPTCSTTPSSRTTSQGGAQITASHNPKAVQRHQDGARGALPLSGDAGIGDIRDMIAGRSAAAAGARPGDGPAPQHPAGSTSRRCCPSSTVGRQAVQRRARRRQRHGRPRGAGALRAAALPVTTLCASRSTARSRTTRPTRSSRRTGATSPRRCSPEGRHRHRLGRRRRPLLLHRRRRRVHLRRLHHGAARRGVPAEASRRHDHLRPARQPRRADTWRSTAAGADEPRRPRVHQAADAQEDAVFGGEVTGHYYFRDFYYADNGFIPALLILELMSKKGRSLRELLEPFRERYFISGEINTKLASMDEVPKKLAAIEERVQGRRRSRPWTASRWSTRTGTSTCARRTPSRCCG
jgi:hypothetical protein